MVEPVRTGVTNWRPRAACRGVPHEVFYPEPPLSAGIGLLAAKLCFQCPVQQECLIEALTNNEWGTWGGTSQRDRTALKKGIVRKMCPACGNQRPRGDGDHQCCLACGMSWNVRQRRANTDPTP